MFNFLEVNLAYGHINNAGLDQYTTVPLAPFQALINQIPCVQTDPSHLKHYSESQLEYFTLDALISQLNSSASLIHFGEVVWTLSLTF